MISDSVIGEVFHLDMRRPQTSKRLCYICRCARAQRHHLVPFAEFGEMGERMVSYLCPNCHQMFHRIERTIGDLGSNPSRKQKRECERTFIDLHSMGSVGVSLLHEVIKGCDLTQYVATSCKNRTIFNGDLDGDLRALCCAELALIESRCEKRRSAVLHTLSALEAA